MKFFLIGMPCCGKSTLGKQLARRLSLPFYDLDEAVSQHEGMAIPNILTQKGEKYFRTQERVTLSSFCALREDFVMATGGGTPCFASNITLMNRAGRSVFLHVPINVLVDRIRQQYRYRVHPKLKQYTENGLSDGMRILWLERMSYYWQANDTVSGSNVTVEYILEKLRSNMIHFETTKNS